MHCNRHGGGDGFCSAGSGYFGEQYHLCRAKHHADGNRRRNLFVEYGFELGGDLFNPGCHLQLFGHCFYWQLCRYSLLYGYRKSKPYGKYYRHQSIMPGNFHYPDCYRRRNLFVEYGFGFFFHHDQSCCLY